MKFSCLAIVLSLTITIRAELPPTSNTNRPPPPGKVTVQKCCPLDSVLVEVSLGLRRCQKRSTLANVDQQISAAKWEPSFFSPHTFTEEIGPRTYDTTVGEPSCDVSESPFPVFVHDLRTDDSLRLLSNGSLSHHLEHKRNDTQEALDAQQRIFYKPGNFLGIWNQADLIPIYSTKKQTTADQCNFFTCPCLGSILSVNRKNIFPQFLVPGVQAPLILVSILTY